MARRELAGLRPRPLLRSGPADRIYSGYPAGASESLGLSQDGPFRRRFLARLQGEISKRGTIGPARENDAEELTSHLRSDTRRDVFCPALHQLRPPVEKVAAEVGGLDGVGVNGNRKTAHFWQLKTAHFPGGRLGVDVLSLRSDRRSTGSAPPRGIDSATPGCRAAPLPFSIRAPASVRRPAPVRSDLDVSQPFQSAP